MNNSSTGTDRLKLSDDAMVRRLRMVMVGAILFSMFNTLAGQPAGFWLHPEQAMRGDGLGIHDAVNHTFEFFLSQGWPLYVLSSLIYLAVAWGVVTFLPRKAAFVTALSVIFGHFYGGSNWLAVRWHLGFSGVALYSVGLSAAMAWVVSPIPSRPGDQIIQRLRWVMIGVMLFDPLVTLIGQPGSYWAHPETVYEGNPFWRSVMVHGWWAYLSMDLLYCLGAFWLSTIVPRFYAVVVLFTFIFGHFSGGSNWFFYVWRLGMQAPVIYGTALSLIIVFLSTRRSRESNSTLEQSSAPAGRPCAVCG